ncbi:LysE family translocator [Rhodobacteraceae bacterium RKSG542]|uniref:LysE family translocator n=1 Tax=Pseudovibrio flavus TaxID=2529854 RepID=UPI0012BB51B8|nr:LysE family translocator [Pseudovibrio flavus]MTI15727.1 LysE family translocator [Pseudovibrio flavus]
MLPFDTALAFFSVSILLALSPGPDNIFVLTQSAMYGRTSGFAVTLGLCTGVVVHTLAVALGVAAIFQTSALAFNILKVLGAAYLVYLAWGAFNAKPASLGSKEAAQLSLPSLYRRGVIMNITNPKVSIFFLSFLPQFVSVNNGPLLPQFLSLGALFIVSALIIFGTIALLAGTLGEALSRSPRIQTIINRLSAVVFVGLAIKLAISER